MTLNDERLLPTLPRRLQIEPVSGCNLSCRMCVCRLYRPKGLLLMDPGFFTRILDSVPILSEVALQGMGEPLLNPALPEMVRKAKLKGAYVEFNTNATLLTKEAAYRIIDSGLDRLRVSIDSARPEAFAAIRCGATLRNVERNTAAFSDIKAQLGSATPRLEVVMVLMRSNLADTEAVVALAARLGAYGLYLQMLSHELTEPELEDKYSSVRDYVAGRLLTPADRPEIEAAFERASRCARKVGIALRLPRLPAADHSKSLPGLHWCKWPWNSSYIAADGSVMPCCMVSTPDRFSLGSAAKDGLAAVWHGPEYINLRAALLKGNPPDICRACSALYGEF